MPRRKGKARRPPEELEEHLKQRLKTDWVRVLRSGDGAYSKHGMGYAVALVPRVARGVVTNEVVPALVRFSTGTGFVTHLIPLDLEATPSLLSLLEEAYKEALKRTLGGKH